MVKVKSGVTQKSPVDKSGCQHGCTECLACRIKILFQ